MSAHEPVAQGGSRADVCEFRDQAAHRLGTLIRDWNVDGKPLHAAYFHALRLCIRVPLTTTSSDFAFADLLQPALESKMHITSIASDLNRAPKRTITFPFFSLGSCADRASAACCICRPEWTGSDALRHCPASVHERNLRWHRRTDCSLLDGRSDAEVCSAVFNAVNGAA